MWAWVSYLIKELVRDVSTHAIIRTQDNIGETMTNVWNNPWEFCLERFLDIDMINMCGENVDL